MNKDETEEIRLLRAYKKKSGLSFDKLGKLIDCHSHTIYEWFRGHQQPSEMAKKLINTFLREQWDRENE